MSSDQLKDLAGLCKCCKVCEGGVLMRQDEIADSIYVVISGGFRILKDFTNSRAELAAAEVVAFAGEGDVLGDIGFMTGARRSAYAEAITSSQVLQITRNIMASMQVGSPQLKHHLALLAEEKAAVSANNPMAYHHEISLSLMNGALGTRRVRKREQNVDRTTETEEEGQVDGEGGAVSRSEGETAGEAAGEDNAAGCLTGNLDALREYHAEIRTDRRQRWRCTGPVALPAPITRAEEDRETVGRQKKAKDLRQALARLIRLMHVGCHEDAASWNLLQDTLAEHPECCNVVLGEYLVASSRVVSSSSRADKAAHSRMTTPSTPKMQEKGVAVRVTWAPHSIYLPCNTQFTSSILNLPALQKYNP
jgi:CRP-like cAMP-binding protein